MSLTRFPGFIDIHVHLRQPGATYKENFTTGSYAALKGGFTYIIDMPNNSLPTTTIKRLLYKINRAQKRAHCDIGFHFGTNGRNNSVLPQAIKYKKIHGLKIYFNQTTGSLYLNKLKNLEKAFRSWQSDKPILVHAEEVQLAAAICLAHLYQRKLHVCHVSRAAEVELIRKAKEKGIQITAGACPHHLFLTKKHSKSLGSLTLVKPLLGTQQDRNALWEGINAGVIDVIETDHAPHTLQEKKSSKPPYGVPGLETAIPLMFKAIKKGKITTQKLINLAHTNPIRIFNLPKQPKTYVEIDTNKPWIVGNQGYKSKSGWSPFKGWKLPAQIINVVLKGKPVVLNQTIVS